MSDVAANASSKAIVEQSGRLGLTWDLLSATVTVAGNNSNIIPLVIDGDSETIWATSLIGNLSGGTRVQVLRIPPGGIFIVGTITPLRALRLAQRVYFTSSGTFSTKSYPGLQAIRSILVGGGGGSGGSPATGVGQATVSGAGAGGTYSEKLITADQLGTGAITVTVGAGGTGGTSAPTNGNQGGTTSFGSFHSTPGGNGGAQGMAVAATFGISTGGDAAGGANGDLNILGSDGGNGIRMSGTQWVPGTGGGTVLAGSQRPNNAASTATGINGQLYGGGASSSVNGQSQAATNGADGAAGICIVEVYV